MNRLRLASLVASVAAVLNHTSAFARSCAFESFGCLFSLSRPISTPEPLLLFSLAPFAGRLLAKKSEPAAPVDDAASYETANPPRSEFVSAYIRPPRKAPAPDGTEQWPVFEVLRRWQENPQISGLSHTFANTNSFMALDYSDIFETGRAPYKGGHGVSLFFQHNF